MSILETLNFSEVSKKCEISTPHLMLRRKMVLAIDEQIAAARAELSGQHYSRSTERQVKNPDTGEKERRIVARSLRRWWWQGADGTLLELKCGNKPVKVGGKSSIMIGDMNNLIPTLEMVKQAIVGGELDDVLLAASADRKRGKKAVKTVPAAVSHGGKPASSKSAK